MVPYFFLVALCPIAFSDLKCLFTYLASCLSVVVLLN